MTDPTGHMAHYIETLGAVPEAIQRMSELSTEFFDSYTAIRKLAYSDSEGGLSLRHKELLFTILDVTVSNRDGALNHLRAARRAGLTDAELRDALIITFIVRGVASWGLVGQDLWAEATQDGYGQNAAGEPTHG
ncbi:hypothetical protein GCM10022239_07590 [Leifsonia bigeumensis]|uniref:Carboxymuconolactone decarboxylase-like domain-containing protein n=1 Tax=Leifsonella bigeumensis TaxID=433643 RepID=A0ABP7FBY2_9MICO